jgi:GTPase Era involved in 16S rRNA processing
MKEKECNMDIEQLLEMTKYLNLQNLMDRLLYLQERKQESNKEVIIPLVGEYSSGKTSLLNALTAGKKLETAITPTTATIFEVYFSQASERAVIFKEDGSSEEVLDISALKNSDLGNAKLVRIYDVSTKISDSTVLVDTPGLSSPEEKHRKALTGYLPHADVVFMVVDINQGVTASLLKFLDVTELARKRVYVIITKCDTKSTTEQEQMCTYIRDNTKLAMENIVCVSSQKGDVNELLNLIVSIQEDKNKIVSEVIDQQIMAVGKNILAQVMLLLNSAKLSTDELDSQIAGAKRTSTEMQSRIRRMISELEGRVDAVTLDTISAFNARIFNGLDEIARNPPKGQNVNQIVFSNINQVKSIMFSNFKSDILKELREAMRNQINDEYTISLSSINAVVQSIDDMHDLSLTIDLELPELQRMNKMIAGGIKAAAVAATVGLAIKAASGIAAIGNAVKNAAAGAKAVGTAGTAVKAAGVANAIDTVTDVGSMISNQRAVKQMQALSKGMKTGMQTVDELDQQAGQVIPMTKQEKKGLLEGLIGAITEHTHAKPQRQKLINDYIVFHLQPEFRQNLDQISNGLIAHIEKLIIESSEDAINQMKGGLEQLKNQKQEAKNEYQERIARLESYKRELESVLTLQSTVPDIIHLPS